MCEWWWEHAALLAMRVCGREWGWGTQTSTLLHAGAQGGRRGGKGGAQGLEVASPLLCAVMCMLHCCKR